MAAARLAPPNCSGPSVRGVVSQCEAPKKSIPGCRRNLGSLSQPAQRIAARGRALTQGSAALHAHTCASLQGGGREGSALGMQCHAACTDHATCSSHAACTCSI
eukprot:366018-Chlamydomonas_euryale.AAC.12